MQQLADLQYQVQYVSQALTGEQQHKPFLNADPFIWMCSEVHSQARAALGHNRVQAHPPTTHIKPHSADNKAFTNVSIKYRKLQKISQLQACYHSSSSEQQQSCGILKLAQVADITQTADTPSPTPQPVHPKFAERST